MITVKLHWIKVRSFIEIVNQHNLEDYRGVVELMFEVSIVNNKILGSSKVDDSINVKN